MRNRTTLLALLLTLALTACDTNGPASGVNPPPDQTPAITNLSRTNLLPGDTLTIQGQNFGTSRGEVWFGGYMLPASSVRSWSESRIELVVPEDGSSGVLEVRPQGGEAIVSDVSIFVIGYFHPLPLLASTVAAGATLEEPFVVRLVDVSGEGVPGERVQFFGGGPGARWEPEWVETDEGGYARSYLTLSHTPGNYEIAAQTYCGSLVGDCQLWTSEWYDNASLRHYVLGEALYLEADGVTVPGWLSLHEAGDSTFARVLTSNYQPEESNSLYPAASTAARSVRPIQGQGVPEATEVLIAYRDDVVMSQSMKASLRSGLGLARVGVTAGGRVEVARVPHGVDVEDVVARLQADPRVRVAEPNHYVRLAPLPWDTELHSQWGHFVVGAPVAWHNEPSGSDAVVVAIIDSGVDLEHAEFRGRLLPGFDFCGDDTAQCRAWDPDPHAYDWWGNVHGTHVAGIVGAAINNNEPMTGVAPNVQLLPVKVFPEGSELAPISAVIDGILWSAGLPVPGAPLNANPADVINLSLGGAFYSELMEEAIGRARERGIVVVAATGNDSDYGQVPVGFPAAAEGVIGVGAIRLGGDPERAVWDVPAGVPEFVRAEFSNYGKGPYGPGVVDIVAPGWSIFSTMPWSGWGNMWGTSMATPYVSGAAALLIAQDPTRTPDDIEMILKQNAYFDPAIMNADEFGAGILRVDGALGLPAPTSPADRNVTVLLHTSGSSVTGSLDLMTGESTVLDLGVFDEAAGLLVELEHAGRVYSHALTP